MAHFLNHFEFFNQPVWLTHREIENPYQVLDRFLSDYSLSELRQHLYEIVAACITTDNSHFNNPEQRANLLLLQVKVEMLFEAVSIIHKRREHDNLVRL
jgi:hypothetical protein